MTIPSHELPTLHRQAAINYIEKLKQERSLRRKVDVLLRNIDKEFKRQYSKSGITINAYDFQDQLEEMLRTHGIKVSNIFSDQLRKKYGNPANNKNVQIKLEANIKGFAAQRAHLISHTILDTTRKHIDKAIQDAHITAALNNITINNRNIGHLASQNLREKVIGRSNTIATTETQIAAGMGKQLENETMVNSASDIGGEPIKELESFKMWIAVLDDHTREAHADADSQVVPTDQPFIVGGEELMIPGDTSLGASLENIIQCRCDYEIIYR